MPLGRTVCLQSKSLTGKSVLALQYLLFSLTRFRVSSTVKGLKLVLSRDLENLNSLTSQSWSWPLRLVFSSDVDNEQHQARFKLQNELQYCEDRFQVAVERCRVCFFFLASSIIRVLICNSSNLYLMLLKNKP